MNTKRMSVGGPLEKRPHAGRWLWRRVGRFFALIAFVAIHHLWFSVPDRTWIMGGIDGVVLFALAYGITWAVRSSPNTTVSNAEPKS